MFPRPRGTAAAVATLAVGCTLSACPEQVPEVSCAFELPAPGTERVPSRAGFNLRATFTGTYSAEELPLVRFVSDEEAENPEYPEGVLLESGIAVADGGCAGAGGCAAGARLETPLLPGEHTIRALALTPRETVACEASITVGVNAPPVISSVTFSPEAPGTLDDIGFQASASDADGDSVSLINTWIAPDGSELAGDVLTALQTSAGEQWTLRVSGRDDWDTGDALDAAVTIVNTAPTAPTVVIEPQPGRLDAPLRCAVAALDPLDPDDEQALSVSWTWTRDGNDAGIDADTVPGGTAAAGETWECSAVVSDGVASSPAGTASTSYLASVQVPDSVNLSGEVRIVGYRNFQEIGDAEGVVSVGDMDGDAAPDFVLLDNDLLLSGGGGELAFLSSSAALPSSLFGAAPLFVAPEGVILRGVAGLGDVNGDGLDDMVVSYRQAVGGTARGAYLVFGAAGRFDEDDEFELDPCFDDDDPSCEDGDDTVTRIEGLDEDIGETPCPAGDLDGDGFDELVLAAPQVADGRGYVYVVYGHPGAWAEGQTPDFLLPGFAIEGTAGGQFVGAACAGPLDYDGDGFDDLVLGAPGAGATGLGRVLVFRGSATRSGGALNSAFADVLIDAAGGTAGGFGSSLAPLGDHDGDGLDDFAVFGEGSGAATGEGAVWIAAGGPGLLAGALSSDDLPARIDGGESLGFCRSMAGVDLDGDGLGDLACGDTNPPQAAELGAGVGARLFLGGPALPAERSFADADLLLVPESPGSASGEGEPGDRPGASLARLPDRDGDLYEELLIGAPGLDPGGPEDAGAVYLVDLVGLED
jgi:glycosylphosphatidylinositol phospholipase D